VGIEQAQKCPHRSGYDKCSGTGLLSAYAAALIFNTTSHRLPTAIADSSHTGYNGGAMFAFAFFSS
jgi:hypothetical protein